MQAPRVQSSGQMIIFAAMKSDLSTSAAFTGHRSYDGRCNAALAQCLRGLHARGFRTFLCGMAVGFDMAAAEVLLSLALPGVRLVAVVPFPDQPRRFSPRDRARYEALLAAADETITVSATYHPGCYAMRNDFLVAHASTVVTYYDGSPGGTHYTVRRAERCGREVIPMIGARQLTLPGW